TQLRSPGSWCRTPIAAGDSLIKNFDSILLSGCCLSTAAITTFPVAIRSALLERKADIVASLSSKRGISAPCGGIRASSLSSIVSLVTAVLLPCRSAGPFTARSGAPNTAEKNGAWGGEKEVACGPAG